MLPQYARSVIESHVDGLPRHMIMFVTSRCNLKCKHCFYWEDMDLNKGKFDIKLEEIEALVNSKTLKKLLWLQIAGGEPFLRKDMADIVSLFSRLPELCHITIPTNGYFIDLVSQEVEKMLRACPKQLINIDISIDGMHEDHDHIRGAKGSFDKLCKTISRLRELKSTYRNLGLGVILVQMSQNQKELPDILNYVIKELKPDHVALNMVRGNPRDKISGDGIDLDIYRNLCQRIEDAYVSGELSDFKTSAGSLNVAKDSLLHDLVLNTRSDGFQMYCKAGTLSLVIKDAGDVYPCEILTDKMGNIREKSIDEIWMSENSANIRNWIRDSKCFCTHECFFSANIAFTPSTYPKLLAKTAEISLKRALHR
jgi:MoaA/NifB/PqqE/SkfB family radical SAM enzyme